MTTIIARNGELVADRRKIIEARLIGTVGVRDEPKIHKLPFCIYGFSGVERDIPRPGDLTKLQLHRRMAVVMGLSYIADCDPLTYEKLLQMEGVRPSHVFHFQQQVGQLRNVAAGQLARELENQNQNMLIMGKFTTVYCTNGGMVVAPNTETLIMGVADRMAAIFLDHNYSYEKLYKAIRHSTSPTGEKIDILKVADLEDLWPPITDPGFIKMAIQMFERSEHYEFKKGILKDEVATHARALIAETIATILTLGKLNKKGQMIFSKVPPVFDWNRDARKHRSVPYKLACQMMKVEPVADKEEEVKP